MTETKPDLMDRIIEKTYLEWEIVKLRHWLRFWQVIGCAGIGWFIADMIWTFTQ